MGFDEKKICGFSRTAKYECRIKESQSFLPKLPQRYAMTCSGDVGERAWNTVIEQCIMTASEQNEEDESMEYVVL